MQRRVWPDEANAEEKRRFNEIIRNHTMVNDQMFSFFRGFRRDAHPMAIMCGVVGALSAFYHDSLDIADEHNRQVAAFRLIAKMPTIAAMSYKFSIGQPFMYPDNSMNYAENFLHMMFGVPCEPSNISPVLADAMDKIFLLHADHEQNASTSTVRLAGSSGANPFACIAAGIAALWGPSHGGANEAVLKMLEEIGDVSHIDQFVARAKDKDDEFRLMGFGHRVYKTYDPRAKILKKTCDKLLSNLKSNDPIFDIAKELENVALEDTYFIDHNLYPNIDFYSGIVLRAIGIPTNMFTVMFAIARTVGWVAQWLEQCETPTKIGRPRQVYDGPTERKLRHRAASTCAVVDKVGLS